mgnify:CR=1 FL=1
MSDTKTSWILELVDKMTSPLSSITKMVKGTENSTALLTAQVSRLETQSGALTGTLLKMGAGAAAFGLLSQGSIEFETGMARANTMAMKGQKELEVYADKVRGVADVIPLARTQITDGLYAAISASVPDDNIISFMEQSGKTAIGANAKLNTVIETTATIVKAYGDDWSNVASIQDKFAKTVQLGQIPSLDALASALPQVTAVAASLKVEQSELMSVFATASGVMGTSSEVATQLNAVLSSMIKPSSEAAKMATNLGIAFDAKSIQRSGGLKNYIDEIMPKIKVFAAQSGRTEQEIVGNLFGSSEAIKLVIGLSGELSDTWASNTTKINAATGTVKKQFDIMTGTTAMKIQLLKNQFSNAMDKVVGAVAPVVHSMLSGVTSVFGFIGSLMKVNPVVTKVVVLLGALTFGFYAATIATQLLIVRTKIAVLTNYAFMKSVVLSSMAIITKGVQAIAALSFSFLILIGRMTVAIIRFAAMSVLVKGHFVNSIKSAVFAVSGFVMAQSRMLLVNGRALLSLAALNVQQGIMAVKTAYTSGMLFASFVPAIFAATGAQWLLNFALSANPIGLVIIGIVALIGIIAVAITYWDDITAAVMRFGSWLVNLVDTVFPGFKDAAKAAFETVTKFVMELWENIKGIFNSIGEFLGLVSETDAKISVDLEASNTNLGATGLLEMTPEKSGKDSKNPLADLFTAGGGSSSSGSPGGAKVNIPKGPMAAGGTMGGGKTVTINFDLKNIFNVNGDGSFEKNMDRQIDKFIGKVNDQLRDALIQNT